MEKRFHRGQSINARPIYLTQPRLQLNPHCARLSHSSLFGPLVLHAYTTSYIPILWSTFCYSFFFFLKIEHECAHNELYITWLDFRWKRRKECPWTFIYLVHVSRLPSIISKKAQLTKIVQRPWICYKDNLFNIFLMINTKSLTVIQ